MINELAYTFFGWYFFMVFVIICIIMPIVLVVLFCYKDYIKQTDKNYFLKGLLKLFGFYEL